MPEVQIHKFDTHYRLPQGMLAGRRRLDEMRTAVLEKAFAMTRERLGMVAESELCIRKVFTRVRLGLDRPDVSLTADWSLALAEEIGLMIRNGASNAVLYHSRRQALMDLAFGVARGDLRRAWAWRQLGLWRSSLPASGSQASPELVRALIAEPTLVVPVLRSLAEAGALGLVAAKLRDWHWEELALAALSDRVPANVLDETNYAPSPRALRQALHVLDKSLLLREITASRSVSDESAAVCRALAVLAVLDVEPMLLRTETAQAVLGIVADAVRSGTNETIDVSPELAESRESEKTISEPTKRPELALDLTREKPEAELASQQPEQETKPIDLRQRALTRFGGLLFLLTIIDELKLPEEILADSTLDERRFVWVIHQLALQLADTQPNDPAALAFAGLPPQTKAPSDDEPEPSEAEAALLNKFVARIVERLRLLLEREDETDNELLEFVCGRRAEIVADPGWIEARFSLDDVSTEIRRSGLDLDPGYVPWLGVVVKFVYE